MVRALDKRLVREMVQSAMVFFGLTISLGLLDDLTSKEWIGVLIAAGVGTIFTTGVWWLLVVWREKEH